MEENREEKYEGDIKIRTPLTERLENFWYHYKWHTIFAVFALAVLSICIFQTCSKKSYDTYILYAGSKEITRTDKNGQIPLYNTLTGTFEAVAPDRDGDGEATVSLSTHLALTREDIENAEKEDGAEVNYGLLQSDRQTLVDRIVYSEYYLCFLSGAVYDDLKVIDGVEIFTPLAAYTEGKDGVELYDERAIKLSSLEFYSRPGVCELPEDTVVCLRMRSEITGLFGGKEAEEIYDNAEQVLKNILAYN